MPRVIGVDIPPRKRLEFSLTYIFGVGRTTATNVCKALGLDPGMPAGDLNEEQYVVEGSLRRETASAIGRLRDIGCYRGMRHRRGLPVRGQRTRTNARTRKGPKRTVAGKKSVKGMK
jgi:small subunit ribosomal protein S13